MVIVNEWIITLFILVVIIVMDWHIAKFLLKDKDVREWVRGGKTF